MGREVYTESMDKERKWGSSSRSSQVHSFDSASGACDSASGVCMPSVLLILVI